MVFVTSDRSQESFDSYVGTMPWLAVPFSDQTRLQLLKSSFDVDGKRLLCLCTLEYLTKLLSLINFGQLVPNRRLEIIP